MPEVVRKAFKVSQTEKPGGAFIDFPENIAELKFSGKPIEVQTAYTSDTPDAKIEQAAKIKLKYVPFNSGGEVTAALMGGHIDAGVMNPNVWSCRSSLSSIQADVWTDRDIAPKPP